MRAGRLSMSSRWISTSLSASCAARPRLMLACAAFTSDDLPMPRAPHSSALLAGRPLANRSVFSNRRSRTRSIPLSRPISTRFTFGTGASVCASARHDEGVGGPEIGGGRGRRGEALQRAAMRSRRAGSWSVPWGWSDICCS